MEKTFPTIDVKNVPVYTLWENGQLYVQVRDAALKFNLRLPSYFDGINEKYKMYAEGYRWITFECFMKILDIFEYEIQEHPCD